MPKIIPVVDRIKRRSTEVPCLIKGLHPVCWVWQGADRHGYGCISGGPQSGTKAVHRISYETLVGPIPGSLTVVQLCGVRACWNPAHLTLLTRKEVCAHHDTGRTSRLRRNTKPRCVKGHEFTEENSGWTRDGYRFCQTCARENGRRWHKEWISKVPNPPRSRESRADEAAECLRLKQEGMRAAEIARRMGLAHSTVTERLKALDATPR